MFILPPLLLLYTKEGITVRNKEGTLVYDRQSGRYDIRFVDDSYYGGLHCGTTFDVLINAVCESGSVLQ